MASTDMSYKDKTAPATDSKVPPIFADKNKLNNASNSVKYLLATECRAVSPAMAKAFHEWSIAKADMHDIKQQENDLSKKKMFACAALEQGITAFNAEADKVIEALLVDIAAEKDSKIRSEKLARLEQGLKEHLELQQQAKASEVASGNDMTVPLQEINVNTTSTKSTRTTSKAGKENEAVATASKRKRGDMGDKSDAKRPANKIKEEPVSNTLSVNDEGQQLTS